MLLSGMLVFEGSRPAEVFIFSEYSFANFPNYFGWFNERIPTLFPRSRCDKGHNFSFLDVIVLTVTLRKNMSTLTMIALNELYFFA